MLQKVCSVFHDDLKGDISQAKYRYAEDCPDVCEGMPGYLRERHREAL